MTAQMSAQMTAQMTSPLAVQPALPLELPDDPAPVAPSSGVPSAGVPAHLGPADLLLDPPAVLAPWNRDRTARDRTVRDRTARSSGARDRTARSSVARDRAARTRAMRTVQPRHLRLVTDEHRPAPRRPLRIVAAGLGLAVLVAFASIGVLAFLGADAAASTPASSTGATPPAIAAATAPVAVAEPAVPQWIVVQPGDSLWTLARRLQPKGDVRRLVDRLAERAGTTVSAGQRIDVSGLLDR